MRGDAIHTALGASESHTIKEGAIWFSVAALTGTVTVTAPNNTVDTITASSVAPITTYDPIPDGRYGGEYVITTAADSTAKIVEVR